jgi:hypothetical protein
MIVIYQNSFSAAADLFPSFVGGIEGVRRHEVSLGVRTQALPQNLHSRQGEIKSYNSIRRLNGCKKPALLPFR